MELPRCRNYKEKSCERSEQVLLQDNDSFWEFYCRCCGCQWIVTKPKTKAKAVHEAMVSRVAKATELDRQRAAQRRYFT